MISEILHWEQMDRPMNGQTTRTNQQKVQNLLVTSTSMGVYKIDNGKYGKYIK